MNKSYTVDSTCNDMRIDRWTRLKIGKIPQGLIEKYLRSGKIKINKKKIKSSTKVKTNDIVNFFNSPAATISAPLKIIQSTKCKTFFINSFVHNSRYILEVEELNLDQSSEINFSKDLNLFMENKIKENPEEYLWQHRRFKSTLGKDNFYA